MPDDSDNDSSAIYQFEPTIQFTEEEQRINFDSTTRFLYYAYVSWDLSPWVRYYEIKFHFNGNEPEEFNGWGCTWRERGSAYCGVGPILLEDEITYYLAPSEMRGDFKDYLGLYDFNQKVIGEGKHGISFLNIHDDIDDDEELSLDSQNQIKNEIREFVQNYVKDWTATVRPVAAQSDGS